MATKQKIYSSAWKHAEENILKRPRLIVFDLETTGLSSINDKFWQIAFIIFEMDNDFSMKEVYRNNIKVDPECQISAKASEVTGVTNDMLKGLPTESEVFDEIFMTFGDDIVSGWNIDNFDVKFMKEFYARNGQEFNPVSIDGIKIARELIPKENVAGYKLIDIANYYGFEFNAHDALADVEATAKILSFLFKEAREVPKVEVEKLPFEILDVNFWEGYKGFSRVYVKTSLGEVFYDVRQKIWVEKDEGAIDRIDMEDMRERIFQKYGIADEKELAKAVKK